MAEDDEPDAFRHLNMASSTTKNMLSPKQSLLRPPSVLEKEVQTHLYAAISGERSKHWGKAVNHYGKLLDVLKSNTFSENEYQKPSYNQLLYESYFHIGIAFQNLNQHGKAINQYTKALEASSLRKKGCTVGCISGNCLHTPVLTRRAFAHVKCDEMRKAFNDADRAVTMDSLNPDVYCIRALVWNTMQEEDRAIKDLNYALRLNPFHICSLLLRNNILRDSAALSKDQEKALQFHAVPTKFWDVTNFNSPEIFEFFNRFLWSLNIPHTVMSLRLPPADVSLQDHATHLQKPTSAPAYVFLASEYSTVCSCVSPSAFLGLHLFSCDPCFDLGLAFSTTLSSPFLTLAFLSSPPSSTTPAPGAILMLQNIDFVMSFHHSNHNTSEDPIRSTNNASFVRHIPGPKETLTLEIIKMSR
ncbi:uncharacterized protein RCH25_017672 [Pelodytes ibericus]